MKAGIFAGAVIIVEHGCPGITSHGWYSVPLLYLDLVVGYL